MFEWITWIGWMNWIERSLLLDGLHPRSSKRRSDDFSCPPETIFNSQTQIQTKIKLLFTTLIKYIFINDRPSSAAKENTLKVALILVQCDKRNMESLHSNLRTNKCIHDTRQSADEICWHFLWINLDFWIHFQRFEHVVSSKMASQGFTHFDDFIEIRSKLTPPNLSHLEWNKFISFLRTVRAIIEPKRRSIA